MIDIGPLGHDPDSLANGINNHAQVIGISVSNGSAFNGDNGRGFTWRNGHRTPLRTLGGLHSAPTAINDNGDIVGAATLPGDATTHATLWRHNAVIDLGTRPGDTSSEATDITDNGLIVGYSCGPTGCRATAWSMHRRTDLNRQVDPTLDWHFDDGQAANHRGQIVGDGEHAGTPHAYLLTPAY